MPETPTVPLITKGTHFIEAFPAHALEYNPDLGFVTLPDDQLGESQAHILGYYPLTDGGDVPATSRSLTQLAQLPPSERTHRRQGQGVGTRLYNTPYAVAAMAGYVGRVGACVATVNRERMYIRQSTEQVAMKGLSRVAHHAVRYAHAARTRYLPLQTAVDRVHDVYGDAETVRFDGGDAGLAVPLPHHFLLVRSPRLVLHGVGSLLTGYSKQ